MKYFILYFIFSLAAGSVFSEDIKIIERNPAIFSDPQYFLRSTKEENYITVDGVKYGFAAGYFYSPFFKVFKVVNGEYIVLATSKGTSLTSFGTKIFLVSDIGDKIVVVIDLGIILFNKENIKKGQPFNGFKYYWMHNYGYWRFQPIRIIEDNLYFLNFHSLAYVNLKELNKHYEVYSTKNKLLPLDKSLNNFIEVDGAGKVKLYKLDNKGNIQAVKGSSPFDNIILKNDIYDIDDIKVYIEGDYFLLSSSTYDWYYTFKKKGDAFEFVRSGKEMGIFKDDSTVIVFDKNGTFVIYNNNSEYFLPADFEIESVLGDSKNLYLLSAKKYYIYNYSEKKITHKAFFAEEIYEIFHGPYIYSGSLYFGNGIDKVFKLTPEGVLTTVYKEETDDRISGINMLGIYSILGMKAKERGSLKFVNFQSPP